MMNSIVIFRNGSVARIFEILSCSKFYSCCFSSKYDSLSWWVSMFSIRNKADCMMRAAKNVIVRVCKIPGSYLHFQALSWLSEGKCWSAKLIVLLMYAFKFIFRVR